MEIGRKCAHDGLHRVQAYLETIVCNFGGDPVICLREEAICAKNFTDGRTDTQTDRQTDDGRRAIALAHGTS